MTGKFIGNKTYAQIVDSGRGNQIIGIELDIRTEFKAMFFKQRIPESAALHWESDAGNVPGKEAGNSAWSVQ